jgi:transposase, IS30 family
MHRHITKDDRVCIALLVRNDESVGVIADMIGVHRITIVREIMRNSDTCGHYDARRAHRRAQERRAKAKVSYRMIDTSGALTKLVRRELERRRSPEQIEGRFHVVSFMTIYRYVRRHPELKHHLRRRGKKRRRYGTKRIPSRYQASKRSIHERPVRIGLGHWEGDTIVDTTHRWSILTHVDKTSGYLVADRIQHLSDVVYEKVSSCMRHIPCKSITYDNGSEFALHRMIEERIGAMVYFADTASPHQRGTNENTNGLIRDYFPKGTSFARITNSDVQYVVRILNDRPRKRLNYLTPREVFKNGGVRFRC